HAQGLLGPVELQVFLAAAILSLLATPLMIAAGPRLAVLARTLHLPGGRAAVGEKPSEEGLRDHVILVGFGVVGQNLARVLKEARIPYLVVDLAPEVVRAAQHTGERVLYGDATRPEILLRAGVRTARVAVFAISDHDALRRSVRTARQLQPGLHLIARTRRVADLEALTADGAQEIVAEEFESSLELFARVLAHYHVPRHVVAAQERLLRGDGYRGLRATLAGERLPAEALAALAAGTVDIYRVAPGSQLGGRSVLGLDLRRRTGANLLALVRDGSPQANVSEVALAPEDLLVLSGSHQEIEEAFHLLDREGAPPGALDAV
ncbi:MAG TPA: NAD-binding protein, partial [Thermoanaerobaculia bacterium]|nr:NAD-binding protein [Thermoanaerobaculia bacterium]